MAQNRPLFISDFSSNDFDCSTGKMLIKPTIPTIVESDSPHIEVTQVDNTFTLDSCLLDALCNLEITQVRFGSFTGITTATNTFTLTPVLGAGETFESILCLSVNGVEQDSLDGSNYGVSYNGLVATTEQSFGSTASPCFGKFTYTVKVSIKDLLNCVSC